MEEQKTDDVSEAEISEIIFNLVSVHGSLDELDPMVMGKEKKKDLEKWKDKLWDAVGYYISMLPE